MRPSASQGLRPVNSLFSRSIPITTSRANTRLISTKIHTRPIPALIPSYLHRIPTYTLRQNSTQFPSSSSSSSRRLTDREGKDKDTTQSDAESKAQTAERHANEEAYKIVFTCKPCGHRSAHRMSKQGYHRGTVLIQCPSCQARHVMSDHLGIFFDASTTLEDILRNKGQSLTHGKTDGNLEFLEDGTVRREEALHLGESVRSKDDDDGAGGKSG